MRGVSILVGLIGLFLFAPNATRAQAPTAPAPRKLEFEVASVKPVDPGVACCPPQIDSARFAYTTTLHDLIGQAYRAFSLALRKPTPEIALSRGRRRGSTRTGLQSKPSCRRVSLPTHGASSWVAVRRNSTKCFKPC
jgi:hypothetical protein